jgi:two-component system nitrogen regulation sensor histidine kinase NtrY
MNASLDTAQDVSGPSVSEGNRFDVRIPASVGITVVALALGVGLVTFTILTGLTPITPSRNTIIGLLGVNSVLVMAMIGMIAWQVMLLVRARRRKIAGARLHVRIVSLFSIIAALPAIVVALFASVTLDRGLDNWFSERTRSIVDTAVVVAQAYVREHGNVIRSDASAMANDLGQSQVRSAFDGNRQVFERFFITQTALRGLHASYLIDIEGAITTQAVIDAKITFAKPPDWALKQADQGDAVVLNPGENNLVRALIKLEGFDGLYLYVHRFIDELVVNHLRKTLEGKAEYDALETSRYGVQLTFALMYIGVSLIFLLAAIWFGFWVADRMVQPIVRLVDAARTVSRGQLDVKVPVRRDEGDLATLGRTFNNMTGQLRSQRDELVDANTMLDERRRFTEAVLSGVTAGVLGLDQDGKITLVNRSAPKLLAMKERDLFGSMLGQVVPEMGAILDKARNKASGSSEGQITLRAAEQERNFLVRVTTEQSSEAEHGYVVTFDDMSELVTAQRNSAWADIARRIAHEIKNPLTPIQLSAERLKRKYQKEITSDPTVFAQCTDTIIRQVGDIGRMVDEFSTFARMPKAVMERQNLVEIVKEAMVLQRVSTSNIAFGLTHSDDTVVTDIDRRLVTQAVTNLIKNAIEAIEARMQKDTDCKGQINVSVDVQGEKVRVDVADNGIGLPKENRLRLVEPYMTTREKGTGLGLAIVKKIMEEHGGRITLTDASADEAGHVGALVRLEFPITRESPDGDTANQSGSMPAKNPKTVKA